MLINTSIVKGWKGLKRNTKYLYLGLYCVDGKVCHRAESVWDPNVLGEPSVLGGLVCRGD